VCMEFLLHNNKITFNKTQSTKCVMERGVLLCVIVFTVCACKITGKCNLLVQLLLH